MKVFQSRQFTKAVMKLHSNQKSDLDKAVQLLIADPMIGDSKAGDLAGVRVHKFKIVNQLNLLAYSYEDEILTLTLLAIGSHENFYRDLKQSLLDPEAHMASVAQVPTGAVDCLNVDSVVCITINRTIGHSMSSIPANELKVRGVSAIEHALRGSSEAIVSVRGKDKYVVMEVDHYSYLRSCELEAAVHEARADLAAGRILRESPEAHLERLDAME